MREENASEQPAREADGHKALEPGFDGIDLCAKAVNAARGASDEGERAGSIGDEGGSAEEEENGKGD